MQSTYFNKLLSNKLTDIFILKIEKSKAGSTKKRFCVFCALATQMWLVEIELSGVFRISYVVTGASYVNFNQSHSSRYNAKYAETLFCGSSLNLRLNTQKKVSAYFAFLRILRFSYTNVDWLKLTYVVSVTPVMSISTNHIRVAKTQNTQKCFFCVSSLRLFSKVGKFLYWGQSKLVGLQIKAEMLHLACKRLKLRSIQIARKLRHTFPTCTLPNFWTSIPPISKRFLV